MSTSVLTIVAGPNAAGKSSFIRTKMSELDNCEIIMTDVYQIIKVNKDFGFETESPGKRIRRRLDL